MSRRKSGCLISLGALVLVVLWLWLYPPVWFRGVLVVVGVVDRMDILRSEATGDFQERGILFHQPYAKTFETAEEVLRELALAVREPNLKKQYILAEHVPGGKYGFRSAEAIGVFFERTEAQKTRIYIVTLLKPIGEPNPKNWTPIIYSRLANRFGCRIPRDLAGLLYVPLSWKGVSCN